MNWLHLSRSPRRGLGLLWTDQGLGLSQSQRQPNQGGAVQAWHWQAMGAREQQHALSHAWPDLSVLRMARLRSGFQAQALALAVPESQLHRLNLQLEPGLSPPQMHGQIQAKLASALPWPVSEAIWDFQPAAQPKQDPGKSHGPAWLQAAMQAQPQQTVEVVATSRAWVQACEQWCRSAGLRLVRLEPPWQADARWQHHCAQQSAIPVLPWPESSLSAHQQAVLGGLALGVVMP
ncbi:MAG: Type pilus assembly protein PilM [Pseudomonadota bacterium]